MAQQTQNASPPSENRNLVFLVSDMECPDCAARVETALRKLDGVLDVTTSVMAQRVTVHCAPEHPEATQIQSAIHRAGYTVGTGEKESFWRSPEKVLTLVSGLFFFTGLALFWTQPRAETLPLWQALPDLAGVFFLLAALLGGLNFFPAGINALRSLSLDMDFLMTLAIFGAAIIGEYLEAAAIAFLFSTAERLETYAVNRARHSLKTLMDLAPDTARVRRNGMETTVPVEEIALSECVLVRPGEKIPVDGQ
ncbi:MAG: cation transporter, partial [bacterium]|nr:cation transporter [bacterium]